MFTYFFIKKTKTKKISAYGNISTLCVCFVPVCLLFYIKNYFEKAIHPNGYSEACQYQSPQRRAVVFAIEPNPKENAADNRNNHLNSKIQIRPDIFQRRMVSTLPMIFSFVFFKIRQFSITKIILLLNTYNKKGS